jgi:hypothetical protein
VGAAAPDRTVCDGPAGRSRRAGFLCPRREAGRALPKTANSPSWVVFRLSRPAAGEAALGVCAAAGWPELQRHRPGRYALVATGFASEADAERNVHEN